MSLKSEEHAENSLDVARIRRDFPILQHPLPGDRPLVFLDSAASAQKPAQVIEKEIGCYTQYYANAHRGVYRFGRRIDEELEAAREKVRGFINAEHAEEVIFTSGTTMSVNLVAHSWGRKVLKPGDEILLNPLEHHANLVPWQQVARETGAVLRYLPLTEDYRLDLSQLDAFLTDRTRLIAVTAMSNVLGTINPIENLAVAAHERGALIFVDAAQSVAHMSTDVRAAGLDFLAFSGHKLFGPSGVGVLYGRKDLLEAMDPFHTGGGMIGEVHRDHSTWAPLPAKFEAGTPCIAQAIALGAAIDYVAAIDFDQLHAHEQSLTHYAHERLPEVPGLVIYGPAPDHKGAIVSFTVEGAQALDLALLLDRHGVAVRNGHHCTMPLHELLGVSATVRASFAAYNTRDEVDALVDGLHYARKRLRLD